MTKWITVILSLLLLVLQCRLWAADNGIPNILRLKQTISVQAQEVLGLKERNQQLDTGIQAIKSFPEAIEEHARTELGMVKENETFYLVVEPAQ